MKNIKEYLNINEGIEFPLISLFHKELNYCIRPTYKGFSLQLFYNQKQIGYIVYTENFDVSDIQLTKYVDYMHGTLIYRKFISIFYDAMNDKNTIKELKEKYIKEVIGSIPNIEDFI